MKHNRHSLMAKGIMVLLSLLVLVFIMTYAWYSEPIVNASGATFSTASGADFEYAIGFITSRTNGEYLHTEFTNISNATLDLSDLTVPGKTDPDTGELMHYNLFYDYTPIDLTGDGVTLIRPAMEYGNWRINEGTNDYSLAEANTQYISFDLIIRSTNSVNLSLDKNSFAVGNCETTPGDGSLAPSSGTAANKSTYGNFSKDAIVGAIRVAFIDLAEDNSLTADNLLTSDTTAELAGTPSLLWVPRPDIHLNNNGDDLSVTGWKLDTAITDTSLGTYLHQYYNIFNDNDTNVVTDNRSCVKASSINSNGVYFNDKVKLTTLSYRGTDGMYYGKIRVRIWVEGTDTESRRALSGGRFKVFYDLTTN